MVSSELLIPYFDFKSVPVSLRNEWKASIIQVLESGQFIGGEAVKRFEMAWSDYLGGGSAIGVANGLDALSLGLRALGIGKGDLVAVPAHTFIATWLAVLQVGATPVGIDVDAQGLIDLTELESSEANFSAVIPVHLHGSPVDMPRLMKWAVQRNVYVVEDCAQAHGARIDNQSVGTWGDIGAFSFYPTKNLGAVGDAGVVVCRSALVANRVREIANYGAKADNKYLHSSVGVNSRLDPIQAAVLEVNLCNLDDWNARRQLIAKRYCEAASASDSSTVCPLPQSEASVWHHFVIRTENRPATQEHFHSRGIGTEIHYPNLAAVEVMKFQHRFERGSFPNAQRLADSVLSLPLHPWLTDEQVEVVCDALVLV